MSSLLELISKVKVGVWQFWRAVFSANRDYPYYDVVTINNSEGQEALIGAYIIGHSAVNANGDMKKLFVSKRTLLYTNNGGCLVWFNHMNNPQLNLFDMLYDGTTPMYKFEAHVNVHIVYYNVPATSVLIIYSEGVLPYEARNPE